MCRMADRVTSQDMVASKQIMARLPTGMWSEEDVSVDFLDLARSVCVGRVDDQKMS